MQITSTAIPQNFKVVFINIQYHLPITWYQIPYDSILGWSSPDRWIIIWCNPEKYMDYYHLIITVSIPVYDAGTAGHVRLPFHDRLDPLLADYDNNFVSGKKKLPGYSGISWPPKLLIIFFRCCSHRPPASGWPYVAFTRRTTGVTNLSRQCLGLSLGGRSIHVLYLEDRSAWTYAFTASAAEALWPGKEPYAKQAFRPWTAVGLALNSW